MTLRVRIESTYTRRLPALEQLVTLAREHGMSDDATVTLESNGTITITEEQPEVEL